MLHISIENNRSLTIGLFFLCLSIIFFTLSLETVFPYYNPVPPNLFLGPILPTIGYPGTNVFQTNLATYPQSFSYNDYYSAYPYLQTQNQTSNSSTNGSLANPVSNTIRYLPNSNSYTLGYTPQIYNPGVYSPYSTYQPVNAYQSSNYPSLSSNTYQTVSVYTDNNTSTQSQTSLPQAGSYGQPNISTGTYVPTGQTGYYAPPQTQSPPTYSPYPVPNLPQSSAYPQNQPNVYIPANPYAQNQAPVTGYYSPNSNYWPTAEISSSKPTAEINGEYRGEWTSDATSAVGQICFAEIDQFDAQIGGEIKLKEFTIGTNGKADITGTVNGDSVSLEINLDGPVLIFEGTVQSNGSIVGSYIVEGSSGSVLDEGTLTLQYR